MITYLKHMGKYTHNQLKTKSLEEIQKLYKKEQQWIDDFVPMDSEASGKKAESSKKQVESSKKRLRAEPDEESVKRQKIGEASSSGEEQSAEKKKELLEEELHKLLVVVPLEEVYVEALQVKYPIIDWEKFVRDDLVKLWDLVKERFSTTEPTDDKEKALLYDTCGVHHVSSVRGHEIFMLVEKDYLLTRGIMTVMLANKLQVD
ncbi:hypothetical protein Tco_0331144 [Tanacetum coccineum]